MDNDSTPHDGIGKDDNQRPDHPFDNPFRSHNRFKYYHFLELDDVLRGDEYRAFVRRCEMRRALVAQEYEAKKATLADFSAIEVANLVFDEFMAMAKLRLGKDRHSLRDDNAIKGDTPLFSYAIKLAFYDQLLAYLKAADADVGISINELKSGMFDKFSYQNALTDILTNNITLRNKRRFNKAFPFDALVIDDKIERRINAFHTIPWSHFHAEARMVSRDLEEAIVLNKQDASLIQQVLDYTPGKFAAFAKTDELRAERAACNYLQELHWHNENAVPTIFDKQRVVVTKKLFEGRVKVLEFKTEEAEDKVLLQAEQLRVRDAGRAILKNVNADYHFVPPAMLSGMEY